MVHSDHHFSKKIMKNFSFLHKAFLLALIFATSLAYAQDNQKKIKAKWSVDKFDIEKKSPDAIKAQQALEGTYLTFSDELVISKENETGEGVIKKGPYFITGNNITLGKEQGEILELSENRLTIKIPNQGILYLTKK